MINTFFIFLLIYNVKSKSCFSLSQTYRIGPSETLEPETPAAKAGLNQENDDTLALSVSLVPDDLYKTTPAFLSVKYFSTSSRLQALKVSFFVRPPFLPIYTPYFISSNPSISCASGLMLKVTPFLRA